MHFTRTKIKIIIYRNKKLKKKTKKYIYLSQHINLPNPLSHLSSISLDWAKWPILSQVRNIKKKANSRVEVELGWASSMPMCIN